MEIGNRKSEIGNRRSGGFTLAEIIVVVIIVAIISTFSFRAYYNLKEQQDFSNALTQIVELIKTARNDAVTSQAVYSRSAPDTPIIPPEGYGVYLNTAPDEGEANLILFANTKIDNEAKDQFNEGDTGDLILETYSMPRFGALDKLFKLTPADALGVPDTGADVGSQAVIIFRPPVAETFISNNGDASITDNLIDTLSIQLFYQDQPDNKKVITIDKVSGIPALHL